MRADVMALSDICAGDGCVERSLATVIGCRMRGYGFPRWVAGVRAQPFRAHAWVEADGVPVDETIDPQYTPVLFVDAPSP